MGRSRPDPESARRVVWELMSEDPLTPGSLASVSVQTEAPSQEGGPQGDGQPHPHRRRRRRRRRGGRGGGQPGAPGGSHERTDDLSAAGPERPAEGVLYLPPKDNAPGVLVSAKANFVPSTKDPLVPRELIQREGLEAGRLHHGFRRRRQPPRPQEGRDDRGHGARGVPAAADLHGAHLDRSDEDPPARDRVRTRTPGASSTSSSRSAAGSAASSWRRRRPGRRSS